MLFYTHTFRWLGWASGVVLCVTLCGLAAGTVNASLTILKEWGVKRIKVIAIIASKQGLSIRACRVDVPCMCVLIVLFVCRPSKFAQDPP